MGMMTASDARRLCGAYPEGYERLLGQCLAEIEGRATRGGRRAVVNVRPLDEGDKKVASLLHEDLAALGFEVKPYANWGTRTSYLIVRW